MYQEACIIFKFSTYIIQLYSEALCVQSIYIASLSTC